MNRGCKYGWNDFKFEYKLVNCIVDAAYKAAGCIRGDGDGWWDDGFELWFEGGMNGEGPPVDDDPPGDGVNKFDGIPLLLFWWWVEVGICEGDCCCCDCWDVNIDEGEMPVVILGMLPKYKLAIVGLDAIKDDKSAKFIPLIDDPLGWNVVDEIADWFVIPFDILFHWFACAWAWAWAAANAAAWLAISKKSLP